MAKTYWVKLWVEMLGDPKVAMLPDDLYRKFIEVLLMAGKQNEDGKLPPLRQMAWILHITEQEVKNYLNMLNEAGLIYCDDGAWIVTKFKERQEAPSTERMRRKRERDKQLGVTRQSDGHSDASLSASASASASVIYRLYESEIGTITKRMGEVLAEAEKEYPTEWFQPAFDEAIRNNARKWNYIEAILKRWKTDGFQSRNGKGASVRKNAGVIQAALDKLERGEKLG